MSNQLIIRFHKKNITWLTEKNYKAKQTEDGYYILPFDFEEDSRVISACGYKHPNLFKGRYLLSAIFDKCLDLIVWDAEEDQISIAATGFTITVDLPTTKKTILEEKRWNCFGLGEVTLKKTLIISEKLGYLTLSKVRPKAGYTRINLNIPKCNRSLKAGELKRDRWEAENESHL